MLKAAWRERLLEDFLFKVGDGATVSDDAACRTLEIWSSRAFATRERASPPPAASSEHFPSCRGRVAHTDLGTPLTTDFYLGTAGGEVGDGVAHTDVPRLTTLA